MKILYLADRDLNDNSGVSHKILMQCNQLKEHGNKVICLSHASLSFFSDAGICLTPKKIHNKKGTPFLLKLFKSSYMLKNILKPIDFDIVYMRQTIYDPFLKHALKNKPLIVEMNSLDNEELKLRSTLAYLYNKSFRNFFLNQANGAICISNEIQKRSLTVACPFLVLANGIDVKSFPFELNTKTKRASIVFIGSPGQSWHGLDKILILANKLKNYDFHIIGPNGTNKDNLYYHGYLSNKDSMNFIKNFDVGICTLALHRNNMEEASPLKSRQYLAEGLPIIYAYEDTDITKEYNFALKLPNNKDNIINNIDIIENFIEKVYHNTSIRKSARMFAVENLDTKIKESKRLKFIEEIINSN